jgi:alpha,alpha-trehalose phosphorylase
MPTLANDPRAGASGVSPLCLEQFSGRDTKVVLVHTTTASGLRMAAGMDHVVEGPSGTDTSPAEVGADLGRVTITADLEPGQQLRVVKFLAYGWSSQRSTAALRDQVAAALAEARHTGWDELLRGQRGYLDDFWSAPMSSWRATPSSNRRCGSRSSTPCKPAPEASDARSQPRA